MEEKAESEKKPENALEGGTEYNAISSSLLLAKDVGLGDYEIDYSELVLEYEIGRGAYGEVWRGKWRGADIAIKKLLSSLDQTHQKEFLEEAKVMSTLRNHPNVVIFMGVTQSPLCLITEFLGGGSLLNYLHDHPDTEIETKMKIVKGIASGMLHLHSENIIHRDLAVRNILLTDKLIPKVSDFGLSRYIVENEGITQTDVGPLKWMSPEAILQKVYSPASDVWSFGVLLYEIFSNKAPYEGLDAVQAGYDVCHNDLRLSPPENAPEIIKTIMRECFQTDPSKRPLFPKINDILA